MTMIYKTARRVAMWLGPEKNDSKVAMDLIWLLDRNPQLLRRMLEDDSFLPDFKALVQLFHRDYWDRLWVVQEVLNVKRVAVYCGRDSIAWPKLLKCSYLVKAEQKRVVNAFQDYSSKEYSWDRVLRNGGPSNLIDTHSVESTSDLLGALVFHRRKLCARPEDKVYGILGILSSRERRNFKIDYKLSPRVVFLNVASYLLSETQRLDFLCSAIPQEPNILQLPSWVPDWDYMPSAPPLPNKFHDMTYAAAGTTRAKASISEDRDVPRFDGVYIDVIKDLGIPLPLRTDAEVQIIAFHHWYSVFLRSKKITTLEDHKEFCRTIWYDVSIDKWTPTHRMEWTYRTFASLSTEIVPQVLDENLAFYANTFHEDIASKTGGGLP